MIHKLAEQLRTSDRGETIIEVMVSFIVLLLVLALFTGSINFASSAQMRSIDARREADSEYKAFHATINSETPAGDEADNKYNPEMITVYGTDGNPVNLNAYKYTSGDSVYWVFR
ncbi:MAG: hypothetical protein K6G43_10570 [Lachnospiraceae bacterium]|nr:hypothetical protein [Lachnospiraceae bacterium]